MIIDALLAADPYMQIAKCIEQPSEYISLTDDIMPFIERTKNPVSVSRLPAPISVAWRTPRRAL